MSTTTRMLLAAALGSLLTGGAALIAGPLNPPAGPAAPTYRTLSEVRPETPVQSLPAGSFAQYVISQPGSYYLTGNITGIAGLVAIRVDASDVSLDLRGFALDGAGVGHTAVWIDTPINGLSIRNGTIANWTYAGIWAGQATGGLYEGLRVRSTAQIGIRATGSIIRACSFQGGQGGASVSSGSQIVDCSASSPAYTGFILGDGSSAIRCAVHSPGHTGISAGGHNCIIADCVIRGGDEGIRLYSAGNRVERCKIGNAATGIDSDYANTIVNNTINSPAQGQGTGIRLDYGEHVVQGNHIYAFQTGIYSAGTSTTNVVTSNTMHSCPWPLNGWGPMIAPSVTTAAQLAGNPTANIAQ